MKNANGGNAGISRNVANRRRDTRIISHPQSASAIEKSPAYLIRCAADNAAAREYAQIALREAQVGARRAA